MDELELLKSHWKKESNATDKKFTSNDLYSMLHKKSSSIVKTLFYISIAELLFWILINGFSLIYSESYTKSMRMIYGDGYTAEIFTAISYAIILVFVYLLYKSHKSINTLDNAKKLMKSILNTRKIIKYYVIYNLIVVSVSMVFGFYIVLHKDPNLTENLAHFSSAQMNSLYAVLIVITIGFTLIIWLFYKLIYGFLLKRLNRNYQELKKLEI